MTKIMLVEDDKSLREIYGVRLIAEGYEIISAGDGEQALAMAVKEKPNLVLSDVMMPKISGFDMLDILRATPETKDMKVIMMTALSSDDQRSRGESLGANKYLVKSQVGIEDVVRAIHDVLADVPSAVPVKPAEFNTPVASETINTASPAQPAASTLPPARSDAMPELSSDRQKQTSGSAPTTAPVEPVIPTGQATTTQPVISATQPAPAPASPAVIPVPPRPQPVTQPKPAPIPAPAVPAQPVPGIVPAPPIPHLEPAPVADTPPVTQPAPTVNPIVTPRATVTFPPAQASQTDSELPQPTAPFSTNAPASLGERIINPISEIDTKPDIADLISQELNDPDVTPVPVTVSETPGTPEAPTPPSQ